MKNLLIILVTLFFSITMMGQKLSNYEKYVLEKEKIEKVNIDSIQTNIEYDDLYFNSNTDTKQIKKQHPTIQTVDTVKNQNITINNYYNDPFFYSNRLSIFYRGGFNFWVYPDSFWYSNYWMYDNYDCWEYRFMNHLFWPSSYFYFEYFWSPWRYNYNQYHSHHSYRYNFRKPEYGHREKPSTMSSYTNKNATQNKRINNVQTQRTQNSINNRRTYTPEYQSPRINTKPQYNNSKTNISTQNRRTINMPTQRSSNSYLVPSRNNSTNINRNSGSINHRRK